MTLDLVNIHFGMHLAHIIFINSLIMVNTLFGTHLAHSCVITLAYTPIKTHIVLVLAYNFIRMRLTPYVLFGTLTMAYIFFQNAFGPTCFYWNLGYGLH